MRLFKNLNVRILKSIITWSAMGKQTAQAEEVYTVKGTPKGTPKEPAVGPFEAERNLLKTLPSLW